MRHSRPSGACRGSHTRHNAHDARTRRDDDVHAPTARAHLASRRAVCRVPHGVVACVHLCTHHTLPKCGVPLTFTSPVYVCGGPTQPAQSPVAPPPPALLSLMQRHATGCSAPRARQTDLYGQRLPTRDRACTPLPGCAVTKTDRPPSCPSVTPVNAAVWGQVGGWHCAASLHDLHWQESILCHRSRRHSDGTSEKHTHCATTCSHTQVRQLPAATTAIHARSTHANKSTCLAHPSSCTCRREEGYDTMKIGQGHPKVVPVYVDASADGAGQRGTVKYAVVSNQRREQHATPCTTPCHHDRA